MYYITKESGKAHQTWHICGRFCFDFIAQPSKSLKNDIFEDLFGQAKWL